MTVSIKAHPKNKSVEFTIVSASKDHKLGIRQALYDVGGTIKRDLRRNLTRKGKSGRFYIYRNEKYRASKAGQFPSLRSGDLRREVDYVVRGSMQMSFGHLKMYGKFLEEGTKKMKARPHLNPVAQRNAVQFIRYLQNRVGNEIFK